MELIIDQRGVMLQKHRGRLRVLQERKRIHEVPLLLLEQVIVASSGVALSSDAIRACAEAGIPIHFLASNGRPYASLYAAGLVGTVRTRRAQLQALHQEQGSHLARAFVRAKLQNQQQLLKLIGKYRKQSDPACFNDLQNSIARLNDHLIELDRLPAGSADQLRFQLLSIEGRGSACYWQGVRRLLLQQLEWPGRRTQGARDPLNSALNYGYGILYSQIERAVVLAGLDPYGGFLHTDRSGKPALVLDLIEEFRQTIVDRTILGLVNRKVAIDQDDAGRLETETRQKLAEHVLKRLSATEPYDGKRHRLQNIIQSQARQLATYVRGDRATYTPFVASW